MLKIVVSNENELLRLFERMTANNNHIKISVIMATYGGDRFDFLCSAIDSVLNQTFSLFELIIVVDGRISKQATVYLTDVAIQDRRVKLIKLDKNSGPAKARNVAISQAKGQYVAIMDADDISEISRLEKQYEYIKKTNADVVGSFFHIINEDGTVISQKQTPVSYASIRRSLMFICPLNNPTVFAKTEVLKENLYDENYINSEDYALWIRLIKGGYVLLNQPEYLLYYRQSLGFYESKRGMTYFLNDFRNRLKLFGLYRRCIAPFIVVSLCLSGYRLLPSRFLRILYRLRENFHFSA